MHRRRSMFVGGEWLEPLAAEQRLLVDPTTEEPFASVALATETAEVDRAVAAARRAFVDFSLTTPAERAELIDRVMAAYRKRLPVFAETIAQEMGSPVSARAQVEGPLDHMVVARRLLDTYHFEARISDTIVRREPIGVCGLISPWNWPVQTPVVKAIFALAAGCTVVLKPSEASPLSAILLAEVFEEAGVPKGVFNMLMGDGALIGAALSDHPGIDLISFTGSTGTGIKVGEAAARTVKKVALELGGKSANIVLQDADLEKAARWNIQRCFFNSGQSCHAPSRMLVHESQLDQIAHFLADECSRYVVGDPRDPATTMGPLVNAVQFERVQRYIRLGLEQGARLVCGGPGRPEHLTKGYFTQPTVFAGVTTCMTIAREEIFGPVLSVMAYSTETEALEMANDSPFGLAGYVFSGDRRRGYQFARELRAGRICFNGASTNSLTPMGGYKQSGVGREMGVFGLEEYLEVKSVYGFAEEASELANLTH